MDPNENVGANADSRIVEPHETATNICHGLGTVKLVRNTACRGCTGTHLEFRVAALRLLEL